MLLHNFLVEEGDDEKEYFEVVDSHVVEEEDEMFVGNPLSW